MPPPSVLRATLEYDGGHYRGWQAQVNARTVQGELMRACREVLGKDVKINGAGRTDAGVHAFAQVASLHGASVRAAELGKVRQDLNDLLPPDINVLRIAVAPPSFHARHSAKERIYRYRISRRRTAFGKRFVYWVKDRLDAPAMQAAADLLVGRHDFASFAENAEGHDSTLVEVAFARVETPPDAPDLIFFRIGASH
ncbi:MAG TPA: tRNA pseudouridine(38-40) synthase TruA, partial [Thermoanaerobaculia bacterium]